MAGANGTTTGERVDELAAGLLDVYVSSGLARQRVGFMGDGFGELAKLTGTTEADVQAMLTDPSLATPGRAVALIRALRMRAPHLVNGRSGG